jgi:hypothetical protein
VQFDEMMYDREPQAEACVLARSCSIGLSKALEDQGQERRADPLTGVLDAQSEVGLVAFDAHLDSAAPGRELDRVGEQIPGDLLQAGGVTGDLTAGCIQRAAELDALGIGGCRPKSSSAR